MTAFGVFIFTAFLLAVEVNLTVKNPTPAAYAETTFVGAMLLLQAALLTRR